MDELFFNHSHVYNGHVYSNQCKFNAELATDEIERIYYLTESHMPALRLNALKILDYKEYFKTSSVYVVDRSVFEPKCKPEFSSDNWKFLKQMYQSLPSEWSIVQLTEAHNTRHTTQAFKDPEDDLGWNCVYLTRFDCGQNAPDPCCVKLLPPKYPETRDLIDVHGLVNKIISEIMNQPFKWFFDSGKFLLNDLLYILGTRWLRCWRFLLFGHLRCRETYRLIMCLYDLFISRFSSIDTRTQELLKKLLVNHSFITEQEINCVLFHLGIDGSCAKAFKQLIFEVDQKYNLKKFKRFPVILILDEHLDKFPWESLSYMMYYEYARNASLHFLYFLYKEHEPHIVNGYMQVKEICGKGVVNPCKTLDKAQQRLKPFIELCLPQWKVIYSQVPKEGEFISLLQDSTVFAYCGHSSGFQYLNVDQLNKTRISTVVFIMGCNSVRLQFRGYHHEHIGAHHQYHLASCPCIVGSLWSILDISADIFFSDVMTMCFANEINYNWVEDLKDVWKMKDYKLVIDDEYPLIKKSNLLEAISYAKIRQKNGLTSVPYVCQGLPVSFIHPE